MTIRIIPVIWLSGHVSYQVWCDGRKIGTRRTIAEAQALVEEVKGGVVGEEAS